MGLIYLLSVWSDGPSKALMVIMFVVIGLLLANIIFTIIWEKKHKNKAQEEAQEPAAEEEPQNEEPAEEAEEEVAAEDAQEDSEDGGRGKLMTAAQMSPAMLAVLGIAADDSAYRVFFQYSFKAKLALASDEVKEIYTDYISEVAKYGKLKLKESRRYQRVSIGRNRVAVIFFKGKKLCVAYSLSKEEVDYGHYKLEDLSESKRFEATPALLRFTSNTKRRRAKELLEVAGKKYGAEKGETSAYEATIPTDTRDELIEAREIRIQAIRVSTEESAE